MNPGECPATVAAVVVESQRAGTKIHICTKKMCKVHAAHSAGLTGQEKVERKKQREALRIQQEYRKRLLEEICQRVPPTLSRHELDLVGRAYFDQLGHDSQQRIFKFFAWEVAKTNGAGGGYVDFPKLADEKMKTMTPASIGKFLVVCALASELYCPSYVSSMALGKDSKLAQEAAHYKVNAAGILQELRAKLEKKSAKRNTQIRSNDQHKKTRRTNEKNKTRCHSARIGQRYRQGQAQLALFVYA